MTLASGLSSSAYARRARLRGEPAAASAWLDNGSAADRTGVRHDLSLLAAALVPRLGAEIRVDAVLGDEFEAGVDVGRADEAARRLPREHLHDCVKALQVRLLVDHKIEEAVTHRLQRAGQHVVPAGANTFGGEVVFAAD